MNRRESFRWIGGVAMLAMTPRWGDLAFAQGTAGQALSLPPLGYAFDALEPHIDAKTMMIHHDRHHAAYVDAVNKAAQRWPELITTPPEAILTDISAVPLDIRPLVQNNLGGHWNHSFFWKLMAPGGDKGPQGDLKAAIDGAFGNLNGLVDKMNSAGLARFGSGWAWLVVNKSKKLEVITTANQDTPLALGAQPVLGVDVWEHAYYLKYENRRADYLKAWWNVVNWTQASNNFGSG